MSESREYRIASRKIFQDSLGSDSKNRIPNSLKGKLELWIPMFSGISDSLSWIPDSKECLEGGRGTNVSCQLNDYQ